MCVIVSISDMTKKNLSRDWNYIEDVVLWPKFDNSSNSMRKIIIILFYKDLTSKINFGEVCFCFKFTNLGLALGMALKFYTSVAKSLKLKVREFLGLNFTFVEVSLYRTSSWIGLNRSEALEVTSIQILYNISHTLLYFFSVKFILKYWILSLYY